MESEVRFRNRNQVILFECELKGQISDGQWENTRPDNHWERPCNTKASVAESESLLGLNYYPILNYGFSSPTLVDCVKHRMIFYIKFYNIFPDISLDEHHTVDSLNDFETDDISFSNIDSYVIAFSGSSKDYWVKKIEKIENLLNVKTKEEKEKVCKKISDFNYSLKDLKTDLRDMSRIWKLRCT